MAKVQVVNPIGKLLSLPDDHSIVVKLLKARKMVKVSGYMLLSDHPAKDRIEAESKKKAGPPKAEPKKPKK